MNISLPTGKVISISAYEYFFVLKEEEVDLFFQSCIADDLGVEINDPFAERSIAGRLEVDEASHLPETEGDII